MPWPKGPYPAEIQTSLEPQWWIESDDPAFERVVKEWTNDNITAVPPAVAAKYIFGRVVENWQVSGDGNQSIDWRRTGLQVFGALDTLNEGKGNAHDVCAMLVALYRAAGIPARVVVGFDVLQSPAGDAHLGFMPEACLGYQRPEIAGFALLRPWVEFYLYDEAKGVGGWIPVDPVNQRLTSSRTPDLDKPWAFFGSSECLSHTIPITFHFEPPNTVRPGAASAFWAWAIHPEGLDVSAVANVVFEAQIPPKRGRDR